MTPYLEKGVPFKELLTLDVFKHASLIAGAKGLDHLVQRVNVMEVPDINDWVTSNELIITTGYPYRDHPELFLELIPLLVQKGVAGLGIKPKRYLDSIPDVVIELANKLDFPLLELPANTVFSEVVRSVMEKIFDKETQLVEVIQGHLLEITGMLTERNGVEKFIVQLEEFLHLPIILVDHHNQIFSSKVFPEINDFINEIPLDAIRDGVQSSTIHMEDKTINYHVARIPGHFKNNPFLLLLEYNHSFTSVDFLTINRSCALIGLELMNREASRKVEYKYRNLFVRDLLLGHTLTITDIHLRAEACGYKLNGGVYEALLVIWKNGSPSSNLLLALCTSLQDIFQEQQETSILTTVYDDEIIFVIEKEEKKLLDALVEKIFHHIEKVQGVIGIEGEFIVCRGHHVSSSIKIRESYEEAKKVSEGVLSSKLEDRIVSSEKLGIYRILKLLPKSSEIDKFINQLLGPLKRYDEQNQSLYLDTLEIYFNQNRNMKASAEILSIHYNTIVYRIDRIRSILGVDIDDPEVQLQIQIALKIMKMKAPKTKLEIGGSVL